MAPASIETTRPSDETLVVQCGTWHLPLAHARLAYGGVGHGVQGTPKQQHTHVLCETSVTGLFLNLSAC
jgi:hypothetical protein